MTFRRETTKKPSRKDEPVKMMFDLLQVSGSLVPASVLQQAEDHNLRVAVLVDAWNDTVMPDVDVREVSWQQLADMKDACRTTTISCLQQSLILFDAAAELYGQVDSVWKRQSETFETETAGIEASASTQLLAAGMDNCSDAGRLRLKEAVRRHPQVQEHQYKIAEARKQCNQGIARLRQVRENLLPKVEDLLETVVSQWSLL